MSRQTDPVCGMAVESDSAAAISQYQGRTYYFCSATCKRKFDAEPSRYAQKEAPILADRPEPPLEKHEPPFTKAGGIVSGKFGSAGSGGAEFDPGPERHTDRGGRQP